MFLLLLLAFEIGHSNLNSMDIYTHYFFIPAILAVVVWKLWKKKFTEKEMSPAYVLILVFLVGMVFLPLGNRLYVRKTVEFEKLLVVGTDDEEGWKSKYSDSYILKKKLLVVNNPLPRVYDDYQEIGASIKIPADQKILKNCKVGECTVNLKLNKGLFNTFYIADIKFN